MSALKYLLEKEFKQFKRNAFMPRMVFAFPLMVMFVLPWVATLDVRHINIGIVDNDHSAASARLIHRVAASDYFTLQSVTEDYPSVLEQVEKGNTDIVLEIPERFERNMEERQSLSLQISANSVDNMKGTMGSNYLQQIITEDIAQENASRGREQTERGVSVSVLNQYNPTLNYRHFMIPALMVVLVIIVCGFLPALNIVGEKEAGTIEQINVTPVSRMEFILAKLIPYWLIGLVVLTLCFIMAWAVYGLVPVGSFWMLYGISILFIWVMSGIGLIVSNYSATMQQAMFVMYFFIMIFMLMSGLFTPVQSMPDWAKGISACVPPRYFIEVMRDVYLKGSTFTQLYPNYLMMVGFLVLFNTWAIVSYKKQQ